MQYSVPMLVVMLVSILVQLQYSCNWNFAVQFARLHGCTVAKWSPRDGQNGEEVHYGIITVYNRRLA